ncbi:hypothetical protein RJ641_025699 [Dillenia turbinata]|uniref:Uncharacterized protein n=1 Tax=Dillenia turbinata TaxID=194707 RepID=A0AAN8ZP75_9MAGN
MALSRLLLLSIFLSLICATQIKADSAPEDHDSSASLLDELNSKIYSLESSIDERNREIKSKDESIKQMEKILQEKSDAISSLQHEIESLQQKGSLDAKELVGKAHARASELEKQVDKLRKEIEGQNKRKDELEAQAAASERKIQDLNLKLENLQKINDEQKSRIRKTERALQVAEEELLKAKMEATLKSKELMEVHGAWLPPWLAVHLFHCQSFIETHWNEHGKPALDVTVQKALEKKAQFETWAEPHIKSIKANWIPLLKEKWMAFKTQMEPHVQSVSTKTVELYHTSKSAITPHVTRIQEVADPYYQEVKKFSKPYIDQVATVAKPHVDKARVVLKPYSKKVIRAYKKFIKSASVYHVQVQGSVSEMLEKHEITKPLATKELVWFAASALLALPVIILFQLSSAIFCKRERKRTGSSRSNHTRRRAKRTHQDK